ncbi:hypothetical protein [Altererythrobacter lutimaris]|uniref:Uncharacterized protein n=1 Tax=Altererythrobacter lutimaris TaxID=2743979 RepID=A0A850H9H5_9SPHN|nr:hypothetical protein [Altererythrobacter lutimaris]NVE95974.1 hypothetical protein [Altererythrobacter lutimaris]
MSKQLAISSAFAVFAMAAMTLTMTAENASHGSSKPVVQFVADLPDFDLPTLFSF